MDGDYEPLATDLFESLLTYATIVVDVGANIGWYTLIAGTRLARKGKVFAFEPTPVSVQYLRKSVALNKLDNIRIFEHCLSEARGTTRLYQGEESSSPAHNSIVTPRSRYMVVPTFTLDEVAANEGIDHVDIMKIDVEGAEPLVLEGGRGLLESSAIHRMIMEWNPWAWVDRESLLIFLVRDYTFREISPGYPRVEDPMKVSKATNFYLSLKPRH